MPRVQYTRTCDNCGDTFLARGVQRFCSSRCSHSPMPPERRFWPKVNKQSGRWWNGTQCWHWIASLDRKGYGRFGITGQSRQWDAAHRFSYALAHGPIPDGLHCLHHCDNPRCVNPAHLFLGTNTDNVADRVAKGRTSRNHVTPEMQARGERHGSARLTAEQVLAIRAAVADGAQQKATAAHYGVSRATVCLIVSRKNWPHI